MALLAALLVAWWFGSETLYALRVAPDGITSVRDFVGRFGTPDRVMTVTRDGSTYYELAGPLPSFWMLALPSSAPAYVFNANGQFVAWSKDPGDDPAHRRAWPLSDDAPIDPQSFRSRFEP